MNATRGPHMCAMPDEILLEISQWITREKDALNWMSTCGSIYGIGQERLLRLNASRSGSGLRWAIVEGNLSHVANTRLQVSDPLNALHALKRVFPSIPDILPDVLREAIQPSLN
ncbi:hypothetical protein F4678DRAFT_460435 [Xylaria arbuscula]|nr:hypothetical protein F4678DRAFT_460435 [Xylaria arbuscula]